MTYFFKRYVQNLSRITIYEPWFDIEEMKESRKTAKNLFKQIDYYDVNLKDDASQKITTNIIETDKKYEEYCTKCKYDNIKPQAFSIYDFLHKNQLIYKIEELTPYLSNIFPDGIIKEIASYSNQIYAKGNSNVHVSYWSIIPTKHMYDNLTFNKEHNVEVEKDIGQIVYIFQQYHPNHIFISEGINWDIDVVLYYDHDDTYCIFGVDHAHRMVKMIDFKFHDSLLRKKK